MHYPCFTFMLPDLEDEVAAALQQLLHALVDAFDEHYCRKIERHYQQSSCHDLPRAIVPEPDEGDPPF